MGTVSNRSSGGPHASDVNRDAIISNMQRRKATIRVAFIDLLFYSIVACERVTGASLLKVRKQSRREEEIEEIVSQKKDRLDWKDYRDRIRYTVLVPPLTAGKSPRRRNMY